MEQQLVSSMEPTKIKCPHCGDDQCFEESQMLDNQEVKSYMCVSCGYTSTTLNEDGSALIAGYEDTTAELVKELRWVDSNNKVWYPIILNFPSFGIIFPDGTSKEDWCWMAAPSVDIPEDQQKNYPIPGRKDEFYIKRIDMSKGQRFENGNFYDACKYIGFIQ